jgi:hypothetical protein
MLRTSYRQKGKEKTWTIKTPIQEKKKKKESKPRSLPDKCQGKKTFKVYNFLLNPFFKTGF